MYMTMTMCFILFIDVKFYRCTLDLGHGIYSTSLKLTNTTQHTLSMWGSDNCKIRILLMGGGGAGHYGGGGSGAIRGSS